MNLPPEFLSNVQGVLREDGRRYVDALPDLVAEASVQWGLTDVQPVPNLSYNFVAFANRGESQVILKIGLPNRETWSEMAEKLPEKSFEEIFPVTSEGKSLLTRSSSGNLYVSADGGESWRPVEHGFGAFAAVSGTTAERSGPGLFPGAVPPPEKPVVRAQGWQLAQTPVLRLGHLRFSMELPFSIISTRAPGLFLRIS